MQFGESLMSIYLRLADRLDSQCVGVRRSVSESVWDSGKVETYLSCLLLPH